MDGYSYTWDDIFMIQIYVVASKSKDKSTHQGALIVSKTNEVLSTGVNGFPRGIDDGLGERQERPEKYFWVEHAERNAIYNAARNGVSLLGTKLYVTGMPCMDCARAIVQSGIKEVVIDSHWEEIGDKNWDEHSKRTLNLFKEAGVVLRRYAGEYIQPVKFIRGEEFPLIKKE